MPLPALASLLPLLPVAGAVVSGIFSAREAGKNRAFQERMSSTAHERERADLLRAGMNPILTARSGGASTPGGAVAQTPDFGGAAGRALEVKLATARQLAEIGLVKANTDNVVANTQATIRATQEAHAGTTFRLNTLRDEAALREMSVGQRREMFQQEIAEIKARIRSTVSSAARTDQLTVLDKLSEQGYINEAEFQKLIKTAGPGVQWLIRAMQLFNLATGEPVRRIP